MIKTTVVATPVWTKHSVCSKLTLYEIIWPCSQIIFQKFPTECDNTNCARVLKKSSNCFLIHLRLLEDYLLGYLFEKLLSKRPMKKPIYQNISPIIWNPQAVSGKVLTYSIVPNERTPVFLMNVLHAYLLLEKNPWLHVY